MTRDLERLLAEAEARPVSGWDFSWLGERMCVDPLPWDFDAIVIEHARSSPDLLDLGTGGGEWLASLPSLPPRTIATEAWKPNVPVASALLEPLGVEVREVEPAPDNVEQGRGETYPPLPFPDASFHLVVSRHESYVASEVGRVLAPDGTFLTEQMNHGSEDFARLLEVRPPAVEEFRLELALSQVDTTGFEVLASGEAAQTIRFADAGALAWYLKAVPWAIPGFGSGRFREQLRRLHETRTPLEAHLHAFWLEAVH